MLDVCPFPSSYAIIPKTANREARRLNYGKYSVGIRLLLLKEYLEANAGKSRLVSRRQLEAYLDNQDFPVEKKTLYADLNALKDYFGMQIEYDQRKKGYRLLNPPFEPHELRMLVDGVQSAKFITREKAREITGKIKRLAGKDTVASLNRQTYVADRVRSMNDNVVSEADRIHQAIAEDSQVSFRYFHYTPDKNNPKNYSYDGKRVTVSPYALLWNNGNYYLYAYDGKKFRYYRVDRMERISFPLLQKREGKELFKEKNIISQKAKVFDMYGGKEYNVRIRFRKELADAVIDQFGKDVMMMPVDADHFTITVPIEVSPTFFAWISTFGRRVKILSPEPVVEKMRDFLQRSLDMYENDGEK